MNPVISVIICTHNPCSDYLDRVLNALKIQTLIVEQWELLLIDNASDKLLSSEINLSWHPNSRYIREEKLGLTPARLRGIKEAICEILVFVDDDNVLDPDYLEVALDISKDWPMIGAWGGQIRPDFEEQPPDWAKLYLPYLALREFERDMWSNLLFQNETTPCGAGLCVRQIVAKNYADLIHNEPKRSSMDRKGTSLTSCGDADLALTACDIGLGTGQFTKLRLTHLIPSNRLTKEYFEKLLEGSFYSAILLEYFRGKIPLRLSWKGRIVEQYKRMKMNYIEKCMYDAKQKGIMQAIKEISQL